MARKTNIHRRSALFLVSASCLLMACAGAARGQWQQAGKLTALDGAQEDLFGASVSTCGDLIVIGAHRNDDAGWDSGSVYVFDAGTGEQIYKLTADDAADEDLFGYSVCVSENVILVGAHWNDEAGGSESLHDSGAAYVFDPATGDQVHKLTASDAATGDYFGCSVSVSGNTIVVGAYGDDDGGSESGAAYVFNAVTGKQLHKLIADDAAAHDRFGGHVSISGGSVVVGARCDDHAGWESGSAYVFDAATGQQLRKLTADDNYDYDYFGTGVAICQNVIVIGANGDDDAGSASGSAYVFDATTGEQLHKLVADDAAEGDWFGLSVCVSGNTIIIGAPKSDHAGTNSGSAYVFDVSTGEQQFRLTADDAASCDWFGVSVALNGNTAVVGADCDSDMGWCSGSAYVFRPSSPCPADVNDDDVVNTADILLVLDAWGACDDCPEDINGDGKVNIDDVFEILGAWGPCP